MYSLPVLGARNLNCGCQQGHDPSRNSMPDSILPASAVYWWRDSTVTLPPLLLSNLLWVPLIKTLVFGFKVHSGNPGWSHLKILNLITSAKISLTHYPPKKVKVPEMNSLLGGPTTLDSMQCGTGACRDNDQKSMSSKGWKSWTKALIMKMGEKMEKSDDGYLDMGRVWGEGVIKDTFTFVVCMVGRWRMPLAQTGPT